MKKLFVFDCDSTLSRIEGVDELARLRGPDVGAEIEELTRRAMDGVLSVEDVFGERLEKIRPGKVETEEVGRLYLETQAPGTEDLVRFLHDNAWETAIVSGGFLPAVQPLARHLGISRVEAVGLYFDDAGRYSGYDTDAPTARSGGKPDVLRRWRREEGFDIIVMTGDGVSDLETKCEADLFIGFGGFLERERVREEADAFARSMEEIPAILARWQTERG